MADSISSEFSNSPSSTQPEYRRRSNIACNGCRRLKMKCDNINMEACQRCIRKNITCEYSEASPSPTFSMPPASLYQPATANAWATSGGRRFPTTSASSTQVTQGEASNPTRANVSRTSSSANQQGMTRTSCPCNNPNEHGCVVPQTPVQDLSEEMDSLNREIAERYPTMPTLDG